MPGARWFEGAELNYAEAVFHGPPPSGRRCLAESERSPLREVSWAELETSVAAAAAGLRRLGVGRGDRVAAVVPNIPEAVVGLLATASLGAIWSSCSPEFGTQSLLDRFAQIEPKVLIAVDGYAYGGASFDRRAVIDELRAALPGPRADDRPAGPEGSSRRIRAAPRDDRSMTGPTCWPARPSRCGSSPCRSTIPLWILYLVGHDRAAEADRPWPRWGRPRARQGGRASPRRSPRRPGLLVLDDRLDDVEPPARCTARRRDVPILYDGSPALPGPRPAVVTRRARRASLFGVSAAYISACARPASRPARTHDLADLRCIGSTGSPLHRRRLPVGLRPVKADVWLASISGGTDVVTAFVGGCPLLPVHAGELQCRSLGARVEAFDESGRPVIGQTGELVLTAPLPSMPVMFWNDPDGHRYRESYFETFPGVWRHGDWIRITERGSAVIEGRSDSTLNRGGHPVRARASSTGSSRRSRRWPTASSSDSSGRTAATGCRCSSPSCPERRSTTRCATGSGPPSGATCRRATSPTRSSTVPTIPRTLTGKKMEVPVKRLLPRPTDRRGRRGGRDGRPAVARSVHRAGSGTGAASRLTSAAAADPAAVARTLPLVGRRDAAILLAVSAAAVFLAGLELMVTAVALPAIVIDLADWGELRRASWIINGYLLVSIATMPLAGRLADRYGVRPLLLGGLVLFTLGSALAGAAPSLDEPHRREAGPGRRGGDAHPGRDGRRRAPVRRARPSAGDRARRRGDVPRHGGRPVHRRGDPAFRSTRRPPSSHSGWPVARSSSSSSRPGAGSST